MTVSSERETREFSAVCDNCGPSSFAYYDGEDKDNDPVWCQRCHKQMSFREAEDFWHRAD